jgi:hypothetical protein
MIYREVFPPLLNLRSTEVNCEWISSLWPWLGITTKLLGIQVSSYCYDLGAWNSNFAYIHLLVRSRIAAWLIPLLRKSGWALENLVRLVFEVCASMDSRSNVQVTRISQWIIRVAGWSLIWRFKVHSCSLTRYTSRMMYALFFTPFPPKFLIQPYYYEMNIT